MLQEKIRAIGGVLGVLLMVLSALMLLPLIISIIEGESSAMIYGYAATIVFGGVCGYLLRLGGSDEIHIDVGVSMILCSLGWMTASLLVSLPFVIGMGMGFLDAYFEVVSGFTTTGMTLLQGLENLPVSLLFLRSFVQWLGGLGILSFFLLITFRNRGSAWKLFEAEAHKASTSRPVPNLLRTIKILWGIYIGLTLLQVLLLAIAGLSLFDAALHSMTTIATGGISHYDASIAHYSQVNHPNYRLIEYIFCMFMFLGGMNFLMHYKLMQKDWSEVLSNVEFRAYCKLIFAFTVMTVVSIFMVQKLPANVHQLESAIRTGLFQVLALLTTTGFETQSIISSYFPAFARQLFLIIMLIGGCVGSTAGGFKVFRAVIIKRLFGRQIKSLALPRRAVTPLTIERRQIHWEDVYHIGGLFFAWLVLILSGGLITSLFSSHGVAESISGMFSAVNNIGPSFITVEQMTQIHPVVKVTYIVGMLAGRLEIIPIIALFRLDVWKS